MLFYYLIFDNSVSAVKKKTVKNTATATVNTALAGTFAYKIKKSVFHENSF